MMESTERATEADPLKRDEEGGEAGPATVTPPAPELKKKKSCSGSLGLAKLSHWRTAAFFFSLFLCLTIVFAFSFIIPCPVRPQYLSVWNRTYLQAGKEESHKHTHLPGKLNLGAKYYESVGGIFRILN